LKKGVQTCEAHWETSSELYALPEICSESTASTSTGSHATMVSAMSPMATLTVLSASAVRSRTSGMEISSALRIRSGSTSSAKGAISSGSLTSLHMVSITMAALRCMITLPRTRRPRIRMGTMTESVALSTLLT